MRETLEDAVLIYKQEAENLLIIAAPAIIVGPVCVLIGASGLRPALAVIPVLLLVYLITYAACLHAAGVLLHNDGPDPARAFVAGFVKLPAMIVLAAPGALLVGAVAAAMLIVGSEGVPLLGAGIGLAGTAATMWWAVRHPYDLPLIMAFGAGTLEARQAGPNIAQSASEWTRWLLAAMSLPLILALLVSWGIGAMINPALGGACFSAALGLWLPFAAIGLTLACSRLVDEGGLSEEHSIQASIGR